MSWMDVMLLMGLIAVSMLKDLIDVSKPMGLIAALKLMDLIDESRRQLRLRLKVLSMHWLLLLLRLKDALKE